MPRLRPPTHCTGPAAPVKMTLGFVGLGVMGGGVAKRLLHAGHEVTGWNRTPEKAEWLVDAGLRLADSPRDKAIGRFAWPALTWVHWARTSKCSTM